MKNIFWSSLLMLNVLGMSGSLFAVEAVEEKKAIEEVSKSDDSTNLDDAVSKCGRCNGKKKCPHQQEIA